jgi:thioredoxin reductase (NADPH)
MGKPVLLAVDSEPDILAAAQRDLSRRFAADYRIVTADTPEAAFTELDIGDQVALVMAGHSLTDTTGVDFLNACHQLHPAAKRLLLITYGDIAVGRAAVRAMALGLLDDALNKPGATRSSSSTQSFRSCSASEPGMQWPQARNRWQSG